MTDGELPRLEGARTAFARAFGGARPTHVARAPGRVNLIGEHVDYAGLPVLPMAIQRDVAILFRAHPDATVRFANCAASFPLRSFELGSAMEPYFPGDWGNYVKAAAQGLTNRYGSLSGIDAAVCSSVPVAAGLSSSSALVIAAALAFLTASDITPQLQELMDLMARAERYVGTEGGGMDQAIALGGRRGFAFRIDFHPVRLTPLDVPPDWRFIVAHSLLPASKSGAAREAYNRRRAECDEALAVLAQRARPSERVASYAELLTRPDTDRLLEEGTRVLAPTLLARFRHVVSEGARVVEAEAAMARSDLQTFGRLMNASHHSLRDDYDVSCGELDQLVDIALGAGASGARLTGAGFGGCIVALAAAERADQVLRALADQFYADREVPGDLGDHLFVAEPSDGASVAAL
jgi:galactokinase